MKPKNSQHENIWERRQAELWDRIFQVTQDVVALVDVMEDGTGGNVVKTEMVKSSLAIGAHLVRANAAERAEEFDENVNAAKQQAIETDYWIRMAYVLQQREEIQRDLSGIVTQYATIIDLLDKFIDHTRAEQDVIARHIKGPRIS